MTANKYRVSFTMGDLFYVEAVKTAALYQELRDWAEVRNRIVTHNVFQARTNATTGRILRELLPRLCLLTVDQLQILVNGERKEEGQILWLAVCKQYQIIREFAMEVIREKFCHLDTTLSYSDFDAFLNSKSEWHEELGMLTVRTRKELRRVLFQMLREAGILSKTNEILPQFLSSRVVRSIQLDNVNLLAIFPISENDLLRQAAL